MLDVGGFLLLPVELGGIDKVPKSEMRDRQGDCGCVIKSVEDHQENFVWKPQDAP
jgi:hypothetical protein